MDDKVIIGRLLLGLVELCVMGAITRAIHRYKGREGGFMWGFGLGIIGIIVAASRRNLKKEYARENVKYAQMAKDKDLYCDGSVNQDAYRCVVSNNNWKCDCGRENAAYVTSCSCGRSKREVLGKSY